MKNMYENIPDKEKGTLLWENHLNRIFAKDYERKLQKELNLRYRYFRFIVNEFDLVAVSIGWKYIDGEIVYSVALQSKNDLFSKKDARKYINDRFKNNETQSFTFHSKEKIKDMGLILACHYNACKEIKGIKFIHSYLKYNIPYYI